MDSGRKHSPLPQTLIAAVSQRAKEPKRRRDRGTAGKWGHGTAFSLHFFIFLSLGLCVFVAGPYHNPQAAQDPPKTEILLTDSIRLNTDLVVIDAQALERKSGRIVNGLKAADFELY